MIRPAKVIAGLVVKDGRLVGVILVGQVEDAGVYLNLIYNRTPLASLPADPVALVFRWGGCWAK